MQLKQVSGESGDPHEREADVAAEAIVSGRYPRLTHTLASTLQRSAIGPPLASTVPGCVDSAIGKSGRAMEPGLRREMEHGFGWNFTNVRIHTDAEAAASAMRVGANAYTIGHDVVFAKGRFAPHTTVGRRLLAHELAHVVQQSKETSVASPYLQREASVNYVFPEPETLVDMYKYDLMLGRYTGITDHLYLTAMMKPAPHRYVLAVLKLLDSDERDNVGAGFVGRLSEAQLEAFTDTSGGRHALNVLYEEMMTGSVSDYERTQGNRIIKVKAKMNTPDEYAKRARMRPDGKPTRIFPVKFMRVTGGDYAPPDARLLPDGKLRVNYPAHIAFMDTFKAEARTMGAAFGSQGIDLSPNEIVGIKDYERGGVVLYLPALALIDYSTQASRSTLGKIVEVSAFAATFGMGSGVAAGRSVTSQLTGLARWGARLGQAARIADKVADVIGMASLLINENKEWLVKKLGWAGEKLVEYSNIANSLAGIYGMGRLAQGLSAGGYKLFKEWREAAKSARAEAKALTDAEARVLQKLDDETDAMLKELEATSPTDPKKVEAGASSADDVPTSKTGAGEDASVAGGPSASKVDDIAASANAHGISSSRLRHEVEDLTQQAANPSNVRRPSDAKYDAQMKATDRHGFERHELERTWCRRSEEACGLKLGEELNAAVDDALGKQRPAAAPGSTGGPQAGAHVDAPHTQPASGHPQPAPGGAHPAQPQHAWNDPLLAEDAAVDLYKKAGVKDPLPDDVLRKRFNDGYRFDPTKRRWSKPHKVRTRAPREPTGPFFRDAMEKIKDSNHPLHRLLEAKSGPGSKLTYDWHKTTRVTKSGKTQVGRYPGNEHFPVVQAGHPDAYASGAKQRYVLEDADFNITSGQTIESKGAFSFKEAVEVDGVWVDLISLKAWEKAGVVDAGTVLKYTGSPP